MLLWRVVAQESSEGSKHGAVVPAPIRGGTGRLRFLAQRIFRISDHTYPDFDHLFRYISVHNGLPEHPYVTPLGPGQVY